MDGRCLRGLCVLACVLGTLSCHASRTLMDETGRTLTVPDHPHRVICLAPSIVDTVYALGAGEDVVAISDFARYPAEAARKPSVGTILTPSIEAIVALHPDLLLALESRSGASAVDRIRRLGLPIFMVDPHGLEGIFRSVLSVGDALNRRPEAERLMGRLRVRVAAVRANVQGKPLVSVFLPIWYDPVIITIGRGAFLTEMIEVAGGRSVTADLPEEWPQIGIEAVIARAPEALLLSREGRMTLGMLRDRPGWRSLPAVATGRVFFVDGRMDLASPVAIDALEDLAREMHP